MTVVTDAVGSAFGGGRKLAAPGAVLLTAGLIILWWGLGIFRGETGIAMGGSSVMGKRIMRSPIPKGPKPTSDVEHGGHLERAQ